MRRGCIWTWIAVGLLVVGVSGQEGGSAAPGLPYVDLNAGLGEGWVHDGHGDGRRVVARLRKGTWWRRSRVWW